MSALTWSALQVSAHRHAKSIASCVVDVDDIRSAANRCATACQRPPADVRRCRASPHGWTPAARVFPDHDGPIASNSLTVTNLNPRFLSPLDQLRQRSARRGPAVSHDVQQDDRTGASRREDACDDRCRGHVWVHAIRCDVPQDRTAAHLAKQPRHAQESFAVGWPELDRATCSGAADLVIGLLDLVAHEVERPSEHTRMAVRVIPELVAGRYELTTDITMMGELVTDHEGRRAYAFSSQQVEHLLTVARARAIVERQRDDGLRGRDPYHRTADQLQLRRFADPPGRCAKACASQSCGL